MEIFFISHLIAVTAWINMFESYKNVKKIIALHIFRLGGSLWITSVIFTVLGFMPDLINNKILLALYSLTLIFFNYDVE